MLGTFIKYFSFNAGLAVLKVLTPYGQMEEFSIKLHQDE